MCKFLSVILACLLLLALFIPFVSFNASAAALDGDYYAPCVYWNDYLDGFYLDNNSQTYGLSYYNSVSAFWRSHHTDNTESVTTGSSFYCDLIDDKLIDSVVLNPFGNNFLDLSILCNSHTFFFDVGIISNKLEASYYVEVNYYDSNFQFMRCDTFDGDDIHLLYKEGVVDARTWARRLEFSFDTSFSYAEPRIIFTKLWYSDISIHVNSFSHVYFNEYLRHNIYGTKYYEDLKVIVRDVFTKQESLGLFDSSDSKIVVSMALEYFFREDPKPPTYVEDNITIEFDPNDLSSFFTQVGTLLDQHASSLKAVAIAFSLFFGLPILSPLLFISLSFGLCACVLSIVPFLSKPRRAMNSGKNSRDKAKSGKAKSGKSR